MLGQTWSSGMAKQKLCFCYKKFRRGTAQHCYIFLKTDICQDLIISQLRD
jgi:hypothetical protein